MILNKDITFWNTAVSGVHLLRYAFTIKECFVSIVTSAVRASRTSLVKARHTQLAIDDLLSLSCTSI